MGEKFWAAREGDTLLHTSFAADFLSGALEIAANLAIAAAAAAVVVYGGAIIGAVVAGTSAVAAVGAVASVGVSASLGCGGMFVVGALAGAFTSVSGLGEAITEYADKFANWLFPPTIQGYILTGSENTRTNSKPAARAAATALSRQTLEEIETSRKEAEEAEKKRQDAQTISDIAAEYFESAKKSVRDLRETLSTVEGIKEAGSAILESGGNFISEIWQPTVAQAAPGSEPKDKDKIDCHKHPSSLSDFGRHKAERGLLGGILDVINPLGALEIGFQAVNGLIGSVKGWCGKDSAEYLAEGARDVRINSQPAARSNARSTCEAKVTEEPNDGKHVSGDVRIGGPLLVVRNIKSGKSQVVLVTSLAMAFLSPGKFTSKLGCFLFGVGADLLVQKAINAILRPVNAATGAKYLAGKEDLDFVIPGHFPVVWQRTYSSRDERTEGLFGPGWSVPFEVSLERTHDNPDEHCWTFISHLGRRLDMQAVAPGQGFHSAGEGLAVRRSAEGLWLITDDDGTHYLFEPDPHDSRRQRLHQMGDRHQHSHTLHYDQSGRLRLLIDEEQRNGLIFHYEHPEHARRLSRIERRFPDDTRETLMRYDFNARGELIGVRNSQDDLLRQFAYDDHHNMTMHRLPEGEVLHYRWAWFKGPDDEAWRVIEHRTDSGEHYRLDWHLAERRLSVSDSLGRCRHHHWNAQGQIIRYQDELGHTSHFEWSEDRLLLGMTDAQDGQWRYVYDRQGHLTETHDPLDRVEQTLWHEAWHKPVLEVDADGHAWQHQYDERGNLISTRDPHQQHTFYHYDDHGLITKITDARGGQIHLRWNEDGQLIRHTDCSGYDTAWFYDRRGQLRQSTNAAGESTVREYNRAGQLISTLYPDGRRERYEVSPAGLLTGITDPSGRVTRYRRDTRGFITCRTDTAGRSISIHYDPYGRMTALANENGERYQFQYDDRDRLTEQTGLDGCRQQLTYDALDNVTAVRFAAGTPDQIEHRFERDAAGRLTHKHTADGCTTYRYDKTDNLLEVAFRKANRPDDAPDIIAFSYDKLGRLLTETTAQGTLKHDHDALGNIIRTTLPDGRELKHHYYGSGHLTQINLDTATVCEFGRDRLHREILRTQGRLDTRRHFDSAGRLHRVQTSQGTHGIVPVTVIDRHYQYDADQLITRRHSRQGRTDYHYDETGRITRCRHEGYSDTLQYDAAANLLDERAAAPHDDPSPGTLQGNVVRFNRLLHFRRYHYQYDAHGRTQSRRSPGQTQHYHYNAGHRLIRVDVEQGHQTRSYGYVYDALGRRTEKHQLDSQGNICNRTRFLWDGLRMVQETRPEGSQSLYIYRDQGSHEPLARVDSAGGVQGNILYFHTDLNGAPEELTDAGGSVVWEAQYRVWGNTVREVYAETDQTPVEQNLRYQGQYLDRETGLHYNTFRYYDPEVGRFTTPDPIGLLGGLNLYQYAPNPLTWVDPHGLAKCHFSGNRGRNKAAHDIEQNGYKIVAEEVTMKVNGSRIRADFVAVDGHGNYHVFEAKHGNSGLTKNQGKSGVFDMDSPSNTVNGIGGGTITPSAGTKGKFKVATGNKDITRDIGARDSSHDAIFHVLSY